MPPVGISPIEQEYNNMVSQKRLQEARYRHALGDHDLADSLTRANFAAAASQERTYSAPLQQVDGLLLAELERSHTEALLAQIELDHARAYQQQNGHVAGEDPPWLRGNPQPKTGKRGHPQWLEATRRERSLPANFNRSRNHARFADEIQPSPSGQRLNNGFLPSSIPVPLSRDGKRAAHPSVNNLLRQQQEASYRTQLIRQQQEQEFLRQKPKARTPQPREESVWDPWGKPGGGAPMRDTTGRVIADRRYLQKHYLHGISIGDLLNAHYSVKSPSAMQNGHATPLSPITPPPISSVPPANPNIFPNDPHPMNGYQAAPMTNGYYPRTQSYPTLADIYKANNPNYSDNIFLNSSIHQPAQNRSKKDEYLQYLHYQIEQKKRQKELERLKEAEEEEKERRRFEEYQAKLKQEVEDEKRKREEALVKSKKRQEALEKVRLNQQSTAQPLTQAQKNKMHAQSTATTPATLAAEEPIKKPGSAEWWEKSPPASTRRERSAVIPALKNKKNSGDVPKPPFTLPITLHPVLPFAEPEPPPPEVNGRAESGDRQRSTTSRPNQNRKSSLDRSASQKSAKSRSQYSATPANKKLSGLKHPRQKSPHASVSKHEEDEPEDGDIIEGYAANLRKLRDRNFR